MFAFWMLMACGKSTQPAVSPEPIEQVDAEPVAPAPTEPDAPKSAPVPDDAVPDAGVTDGPIMSMTRLMVAFGKACTPTPEGHPATPPAVTQMLQDAGITPTVTPQMACQACGTCPKFVLEIAVPPEQEKALRDALKGKGEISE